MTGIEHPDIRRVQLLGDDAWGDRKAVDDCDVCHKPIYAGDWVYELQLDGGVRKAHENCICFYQAEDSYE